MSANGEAAARIAELEAEISTLRLAREGDYDRIMLALEQVARREHEDVVLADMQKDLHRLTDAVCEFLELRR